MTRIVRPPTPIVPEPEKVPGFRLDAPKRTATNPSDRAEYEQKSRAAFSEVGQRRTGFIF